jgi:hypothetical protein
MTSATTISTIVIEPEAIVSTESNKKVNFEKRFKPSNLKKNDQSNKQKPSPSLSVVRPLRADDIKEHRLWALGSTIVCFFVIAPVIALYHSRRIREMKNNQELTRAKLWSDRVSNILVISNLIGIFIWVALIFVIAVLFVMGAVY